jgi:folate-dependent phosphoribosylglycinamide formyltransferase PurN
VKSAVILISGRGSNMRALVEARTGLEVRAC